MNIVERQAIEDLFAKLRDAEKNGGERDPEAEELIAKLVKRQPAVAYYLAQTVLVQQWALNAAHDRIDALERQRTGGLLAALFGSRRQAPRDRSASPLPPSLGQTATTGFLATASNTALGVAGGFVLADMLAAGNFSDQSLAASVNPPAAAPVDAGGALGSGMAGGDFGGADFGGGGDAGGF